MYFIIIFLSMLQFSMWSPSFRLSDKIIRAVFTAYLTVHYFLTHLNISIRILCILGVLSYILMANY